MTADDIIAANPDLSWSKSAHNGREILISTDSVGTERWVIWRGNHHASCLMPITPRTWRASWHNLNMIQPGRNHATVGDDVMHDIFRRARLEA